MGVAAFLLSGVTLPPSGVRGVGVSAPFLPDKLLLEPYRDEFEFERLTIDCAGVTLLLCIALRLRLGVPPLKLSALLYMLPLLPAKLHVSTRPQ